MTTEDDFQAKLDADPADWQTRVVFADWLDEQGDPRAAGYRALGELGFAPSFAPVHNQDVWWVGDDEQEALQDVKGRPYWSHFGSLLPRRWWLAVKEIGGSVFMNCWLKFKTRREAEECIVLAFSPSLLNGPVCSP